MHHPTGVFSGSDGGFYLGGKFGCVIMVKQWSPMNATTQGFLNKHLYTELLWFLRPSFSAVADSV